MDQSFLSWWSCLQKWYLCFFTTVFMQACHCVSIVQVVFLLKCRNIWYIPFFLRFYLMHCSGFGQVNSRDDRRHSHPSCFSHLCWWSHLAEPSQKSRSPQLTLTGGSWGWDWALGCFPLESALEQEPAARAVLRNEEMNPLNLGVSVSMSRTYRALLSSPF